MAALKPEGKNILEIVLDYGTMVFQDGRQFVGEFSITHREIEKFDYYQVPANQCSFSKESYVFFGSMSHNGVPDPSGL